MHVGNTADRKRYCTFDRGVIGARKEEKRSSGRDNEYGNDPTRECACIPGNKPDIDFGSCLRNDTYLSIGDGLARSGMRYWSPVLPLAAMAAAIIIVKASRGNALIWLSLLFVFGLTKLAQLTPWVAANPSGLIRLGKYSVGAHVPAKMVDRFLGVGLLIYVRDLWRENPGTVAKSCKFLRENAKSGDVLIVNYAMEPTYFYTRLTPPTGILRQYPVYQAARELGLPEYVFGVDHVRWIVWRSAWETGPGYAINDVIREIVERGGQITGMMEMEETVWENREDIHFHRFSDGTYLFPRTQTFPMSRIRGVDCHETFAFGASLNTRQSIP